MTYREKLEAAGEVSGTIEHDGLEYKWVVWARASEVYPVAYQVRVGILEPMDDLGGWGSPIRYNGLLDDFEGSYGEEFAQLLWDAMVAELDKVKA